MDRLSLWRIIVNISLCVLELREYSYLFLLIVSIMLWCAVCPRQCQLLWNWEFPSLFTFGFEVKLGKILKCQSFIELEQKCWMFSIKRKYFYIPEMEEFHFVKTCSLNRVIILVPIWFHGSQMLLQFPNWTIGFSYYTTWEKYILRDTVHYRWSPLEISAPQRVGAGFKK